jgi:hypothetical protein
MPMGVEARPSLKLPGPPVFHDTVLDLQSYFKSTVAPQKCVTTLIHRYVLPRFCRTKILHMDTNYTAETGRVRRYNRFRKLL